MRLVLQLAVLTAVSVAWPGCPGKMTQVDTFDCNGGTCVACEDLQQPGGSIAVMQPSGNLEWFSKSYSVYGSADDQSYYLNLTKQAVMQDKADILAVKLLSSNYSFLTWQIVASAIPPIRHTGNAGLLARAV